MYLLLDLQVHDKFGAGVAALNTVRELLDRDDIDLLLAQEPKASLMAEDGSDRLASIWALSQALLNHVRQDTSLAYEVQGSVVLKATYPFVFDKVSGALRGTRKTLANYVFEQTEPPPNLRRKAAIFDTILCASEWCRSVLAQHGVMNTAVNFQSADVSRFRPMAIKKHSPFTIFSGGKFEYRKGQDLVAEAFRRFSSRHEDVQLCLLWNNRWFDQMGNDFAKMRCASLPKRNSYTPWLVEMGIPSHQILEIHEVNNEDLPPIINRCHLGVFPSRAEGGTNICAMETLACGVPAILSRNTGHLDLAGAGERLYLTDQAEINGLPGWGESNVNEMVSLFEWAYENRNALETLGNQARNFMLGRTWKHHVDNLVRFAY